MLRDDLTYYWFSEVMQEDSLGNCKSAIKHYIRQPKMDFDKVLSLFNQDAILEFTSLTCLDIEDEKITFPPKGDSIVEDDAFLDGLIVFNKREKINVLRNYLKQISFRVSRFSFITSDGMVCYNNQNRQEWLEIDVEMPVELKEVFLRRVYAVDSGLGTILTDAEKYPNSFLSFQQNKLVNIFPNVYNTDKSLFKDVDRLATEISFGFIHNIDPYPSTW